MDGWRKRETEIRKSDVLTKLALWIIQHNTWEAAWSLWTGRHWMSYVCLHFMQYGYGFCFAVSCLSTCLWLIHHLQHVHELPSLHPFGLSVTVCPPCTASLSAFPSTSLHDVHQSCCHFTFTQFKLHRHFYSFSYSILFAYFNL